MILETFAFDTRRGFSAEPFPQLDSERTLVLCFAAPEFIDDPRPIQGLRRAYPRSHLLGCSTSGEILGTAIFDHSISIAVARFEGTQLRVASAPAGESEASRSAGVSLGQALLGPDLRAVFVFSDGLRVNGSELVRGLGSVLPETVLVTGGLAGDGDRFMRTWVIKDGAPAAGWISAVGLYGDHVRVGYGSKGGWDLFGPPRRVTRSRGNVLFELDGQPALQLYRRYLGELAAGLPANGLLFPLAVFGGEDERSLVRTILAVDEERQSLTFAGDIPEGSRAQLMRANFDRLVDGAAGAAKMSRSTLRDGDRPLAIAISCVGRRLVLGERTEDEVEATMEVLPDQTQQIGFYSYGEISPHGSGACTLHNQTMTLTTLCEVAAS